MCLEEINGMVYLNKELIWQTVMRSAICSAGVAAIASFSLPAYADQTPDEEGLPRLTPVPTPTIQVPEEDSQAAEPAPDSSHTEPSLPTPRPTSNTVELNLPDLINVVIQGNRDLKNAVLDRVVQRQTLQQEERAFSPRLTPNVSIQATRTLLESESVVEVFDFEDGFDGQDRFERRVINNNRTNIDEDLGISATLRTPIGTEIELALDPIDEFSRVNLTVRQPLMRGAGQAVNRAPIQQARIADDNNILALRQQVIDTITTSITQYTTLVQAQEAVVIQAQALERRQQQFEIISALVEAGRQARVELSNSQRSIAEAELSLQAARNQLAQANTDLLNLIGSDAAHQFVVPDNAIAQLFAQAVRRASEFERDELIAVAYQVRPDYQQARSQLEIEDLNLLLARDNRRWSLDWQNTARVGDDATQLATGLRLSRTFGDESLNTAVIRSETTLLQQQNTIAQLTDTIRNQVADRLRDVKSELAQVESAQRATEAAQLQLQVTKEKFKLGRDGTTLFDITQQEENLVSAQNAELQARISVLNSVAELERTVGITIETWQPLVDFSYSVGSPAH